MTEPEDPKQQQETEEVPSAEASNAAPASEDVPSAAPGEPQQAPAAERSDEPAAQPSLEEAAFTEAVVSEGATDSPPTSTPPESQDKRPVMEILGAKAQPPSPKVTAERKKDRMVGMLLIVITFLATLCLAWWAKSSTEPPLSQPPQPPTKEGIVGWPNAVDPMANLSVARGRTERSELRGIIMEHVKSDGTVDTEKMGRLRYVFQSKKGEGPQPDQDAGRISTPYCGKQHVLLNKKGIGEEDDQPRSRCPGKTLDALPDPPGCTPKQVWQYAMDKKSVPKDRTARIEYYTSRAGPAWRFRIVGKAKMSFVLYGDCGRELKGAESVGSVR